MSVMEHSRHNAKWTSGIHSDKFPVFHSVLIRFYFKVGIYGTLESNGFWSTVSVKFWFQSETGRKFLKLFVPCPS